jgi:hypothetical protein
MVGFQPLTDLIGGGNPRIFAKKSMQTANETHPYLVYKLGNSTAENLSEDTDIDRQFFQVWVHDYHSQDIADYAKIDDVIKQLKAAFRLAGSKADGVWTTIYLETSQDLNDETLGTIFRYVRFQLIKKEM